VLAICCWVELDSLIFMRHMDVVPIIIVLHTKGCIIKVDIFPAVRKRKKYPSMYIPKLRTTLFQEVEIDESVTDPIQNMLVVLVKQIARSS
jgi:hypothetical protein